MQISSLASKVIAALHMHSLLRQTDSIVCFPVHVVASSPSHDKSGVSGRLALGLLGDVLGSRQLNLTHVPRLGETVVVTPRVVVHRDLK